MIAVSACGKYLPLAIKQNATGHCEADALLEGADLFVLVYGQWFHIVVKGALQLNKIINM